jgi:hypothetical protein
MRANKLMDALLATVGIIFIGLMFGFVGINFLLGCETWDQSYWTEYNSCITPTQLVDSLFN